MDAIGTWSLTLSTTLASQDMQLHVLDQGAGFSGVIESAMGNSEIAGVIDGDRLQWTMRAEKPIKLAVKCDVAITGDLLDGVANLGFLGKGKIKGERVSRAPKSMSADSASMAEDLITESTVDELFHTPVVEVDEWREHPVPHRYVHGRFDGTRARFSFYYPPADRYERRFFHNTYPLAVSADIGPFPIQFEVATGDLGFTIDSGAYYVQTNNGLSFGSPDFDPTIAAFRVNAAAAKFSRIKAAEIYGPHRPFGYLFGGSGGAYQTMGAAENTSGVWDGFLPFVPGSNNAIPGVFTVRMHALRVLRLRNKFPGIVDALEPGGSGNPDHDLNEEEQGALEEASQLGFPPRAWYGHETLGSGYFSSVAGIIPMLDPSYVDDFWSKPGYLGSNPAASIHAARFRFPTQIVAVEPGSPTRLELAQVPDVDVIDSHVVALSGSAAGSSFSIAERDGTRVTLATSMGRDAAADFRPGDEVVIDNSWPLALQTYHRHQLPEGDAYWGWHQFRDEEGTPIYPQREVLVGPIATANAAGAELSGKIHGKVLMLSALMDYDSFAWQADWYRSQVRRSLGDAFDDSFALYFIDRAHHENPQTVQQRTQVTSYTGALQQALRDLSAWVETGSVPLQTNYEVLGSQVVVPSPATARGGIQPVISLTANGGCSAVVASGESVYFSAMIETPPGAGKIVAAEWDFDHTGEFAIPANIENPDGLVHLAASWSYTTPGTYFAALRVASQRQGHSRTPYARVSNLARVRVVVQPNAG